MTEEQKADWIKYQLQDLAAYDASDIESGSIEIYGENEDGYECSCEVEIPSIAEKAAELIAELESELDKYKHLAKERGEFIINGEDLGYIQKPTSENDSAYYIFLRCQMTDETAAKAV